MFVLTIDQRRSRADEDRVPLLLAQLEPIPVASPFVRTAGDEVQGVITDPEGVVVIIDKLLRSGKWRCGIGAGAGELFFAKDAPDSRSGRVDAFVLAREALESVKNSRHSIALRSRVEEPASEGEALIHLMEALSASRTRRQWEIIETVEARETMSEAAQYLGVSPSAVSQVYAQSARREQRACYGLLRRLLSQCDPKGNG